MDFMLFADLDIQEASVKGQYMSRNPSNAEWRQSQLRMKKILSGEIDVNSISIPVADMKHLSSALSLDDVRIIVRQLGFVPFNLIDASSRDALNGHPQVLKLYPLNSSNPTLACLLDEERIPFPTSYWISCPILHARISRLEEGGWVQKLLHRFLNSADSLLYKEAMQRAHRLYAEERWA